MDRARKRFANNLAKIKAYNPEMVVLGDRKWIDECTNDFIVHMSRKMWMHEFTQEELPQIEKAVIGYLRMRALVESSTPVQPGNRIVRGTVTSMKQRCRNHEPCGKHWFANVRTEDNNTIFTPMPEGSGPELVGQAVEYFAYITVSTRDKGFGFAHHTKLMKFKEKSNAS